MAGEPPREEAELALGVEIGAIIAGKYRVDRLIGTGGMGVVVAASQLALDRTVAIKLIRPELADNTMVVERLLREAKAVASIQSEHVARVLDVGTLESGVPFIVMEYLEGSDLETTLAQEGPLPAADAVDFVLQACEAIAEAHRNGIVHRDLKPANLFVARLPGGRPSAKVVDFGISKLVGLRAIEPLTQPSNVVGSLYHMAPEQMRGEAVDARTDLWALGVLLFEMITGNKPFRDAAWPAVCAEVLYDPLPILAAPVEGLSDELRAVIQKCLRRQPHDRYGNIAELAVNLSRFGSHRAQVSLERIVSLATSTGSLSALAPPANTDAEPASDRGTASKLTRPVPPPEVGALPSVPSHGTRATPATPVPVSSSPHARGMPLSRQISLGIAGALLVIVPGVVWLWQRTPAEVAPSAPAARQTHGGHEGAAPATVAEPASARKPASSEGRLPEGAAETTTTTERRSDGTGGEVTNVPSGSGADRRPTLTPATPNNPALEESPAIAPVSGAASSSPAPAHVEDDRAQERSRPSSRLSERDTSRPRIPSRAAPAARAPREEPPRPVPAPEAPPEASPPARAHPTRNKPASPWDLEDITFEGGAKR
jgi:eukaryotic-like serine/threonine-protein kinase